MMAELRRCDELELDTGGHKVQGESQGVPDYVCASCVCSQSSKGIKAAY
jgi:hypothetical protein